MPADLTEEWIVTPHGIKRKDWDCTISFGTYPPPKCFEMARQYEAKAVEMRALQAELAEKEKGKGKKKAKQIATQERLEL